MSTIAVSGTCNENFVIDEHHQNITIDGMGSAIISNPDASVSTVSVRGRGITIKNFASITGGSNGVIVLRGGAAIIEGNTIQNIVGNGINVNTNSTARILSNVIQNNTNGIVVTGSSSARIGFNRDGEAVTSPNTIQNNTSRGVLIGLHSSGQIVGNIISGSLSDGILVHEVSHSDIASNTISNNGGYGINVGRNSGAQLGSDTGTTIFDSPNSGSGNALFGIRCFINSYVDGRQGTITGNSGATDFTSTSCINSLIP